MPEVYKHVKLPEGFRTWVAEGVKGTTEPYAVTQYILRQTSPAGLRKLVRKYKKGEPFSAYRKARRVTRLK